MKKELSNEEKRRISYQRQNAVRMAWKQEKARVGAGIGTRMWSESEQKELLKIGRVTGYEGHHMKSVSLYPEYAGNSKNIQFLTEEEHLYGAHNGSYHNLTNGYYDPVNGVMNDFGKELGDVPTFQMENSSDNENLELIRLEYQKESEQSVDDNKCSIDCVRDSYNQESKNESVDDQNNYISNGRGR